MDIYFNLYWLIHNSNYYAYFLLFRKITLSETPNIFINKLIFCNKMDIAYNVEGWHEYRTPSQARKPGSYFAKSHIRYDLLKRVSFI